MRADVDISHSIVTNLRGIVAQPGRDKMKLELKLLLDTYNLPACVGFGFGGTHRVGALTADHVGPHGWAPHARRTDTASGQAAAGLGWDSNWDWD